jgi:VWFA-related protein
MTDGVDNALPDVVGEGSRTSFEELLNVVRTSDTLVFPIYLDTEDEESRRHRTPRSAFAISRNQLAQLAEACGTRLYRADKLKDLDEVYGQVIGDLGRVYSIGYRPSNTFRDGKWRSVTVQILERSDLSARTKRGYYARNETN